MGEKVTHATKQTRSVRKNGKAALNENGAMPAGLSYPGIPHTGEAHQSQDLQIQKSYLEQLFESAPEAIAILKMDNTVSHINPEFTRLLGCTQEEVSGKKLHELIFLPDRKRQHN